jgi:hypothetical protein
MPSRTSYLLRISGRVRGSIAEDLKKKIDDLFRRPTSFLGEPLPGQPPLGAGWPDGFVLKGYNLCEWTPSYEPYHDMGAKEYEKEQTLFNFRTEVHSSLPGTLHDNRDTILPHVEWFYSYRFYHWHRELKNGLHEVNELAEKAGVLVEPIWFREYQIYCGNGGP